MSHEFIDIHKSIREKLEKFVQQDQVPNILFSWTKYWWWKTNISKRFYK